MSTSNVSISFEYGYLCDHFFQIEALDGLLQCAMAVGPVGQKWETRDPASRVGQANGESGNFDGGDCMSITQSA